MTTINSLDDFLQALDANPSWREAVRARILGEELLQLPVRFGAFASRQEAWNEQQQAWNEQQQAWNEEQRAWNEEQRAWNEEQRAWNEEQRAWNESTTARLDAFISRQETWNENTTARLNRMEGDIGSLKGFYARNQVIQDAPGIAEDMGFEFVRVLSNIDLSRMAGGRLDRDTLRSFRNADLVMEATDDIGTSYIALEISFTADRRETGRAMRNAEFITQFTGRPARPAIASVRNDREAAVVVESGAVYWYQLQDRTPNPE